jgi:hypothetical protein
VFVISAAVLLPLTLSVGIVATFRIAGPLHRFETFLRAIANGEKPADCKIRRGDELQEFCTLLNDVTAPLRTGDAPSADAAVARDDHARAGDTRDPAERLDAA